MNLQPLLVPMKEHHLDAVMPYEESMFGTEAWSREAYRDELRDNRYRRYFAVLQGAEPGAEPGAEVGAEPGAELLGWGGVRVIGKEAEILTVGVVPSARRAGIATLLLRHLLADARRRSADEVFLEVRVDNEAAINLYRREGFADLGRRRGYYDGGRVDALTMHRRLTQEAEV
ncbi:ribosomal-protein-alanine N-acetyltransferase [Jatrophihabitans sp. GAS493]|uniref:ribosomal protein S18-alanine N-acetyltransferase n=1 Tax=Jatrophihabitans sp. GAS493 TaxID=1907575 RepID=UPI000BB6A4AF|nr:ribosomal protein S18-alanine N-acetyltransferase [Jatrophihabitans sp. GAS493]SOD70390.1 ribosomal-protein-alanine N-acetyltransferase [Jatrophihabitans sp. GAS493]